VATFASVRSANRSARLAELALQEQRRPLLAPSRLEDPVQKIMFVDGRWVRASGGHGVAEQEGGAVYLAISLRNVGSGIAVCQGWAVRAGMISSRTAPTHTPEDEFRFQSRDLYVPAGDIGMWQGALRNPDDPARAEIVEAIEAGEPISVELLYSDQVGGQRTITRFGLTAVGDSRLASMNRHWHLERAGPRPEIDQNRATEAVLQEQERAERFAASQVEERRDGGPEPASDAISR
jgi:hypothetical protein